MESTEFNVEEFGISFLITFVSYLRNIDVIFEYLQRSIIFYIIFILSKRKTAISIFKRPSADFFIPGKLAFDMINTINLEIPGLKSKSFLKILFFLIFYIYFKFKVTCKQPVTMIITKHNYRGTN